MDESGEVFRVRRLGDELQVSDAVPDGDVELVGVDQTGEGDTGRLAASGLHQEVVVLREENASQFRGPVEDLGIGKTPAAVLLNCEDVDAA